MPSKVTLEEAKLIHHCWITRKFRTGGVSNFITLVLLYVRILSSMQDWLQEGKTQKKKDKQHSSQPWMLCAIDSQEREYQDVSKPRQVHYKIKWKVSQDAIYCINLRKAQDKGQKLWQTRSNAILLKDSVPADCVERVVNTKTEEILCQIDSFISTLATTQLLWRIPGRFSSAWYQYGETLGRRGKNGAQD